MKLLVGLPGRILAAAIAAALMATVATTLTIGDATRAGMAATIARHWRSGTMAADYARCRQDPARWSRGADDGVRAFAYDPATRRSLNPAAPPLDAVLFARISRGQQTPMRIYLARASGGAALLRMADHGPCALVQVDWPVDRTLRRRATAWSAAGLFGTLASTFLLVTFLIIRPLRRRIDALQRATHAIGVPADYRSADAHHRDVLSDVARGVDAAHARICADAAKLAAGHAAQERFVADVAHDLRTPITSLQLSLEELAGRLDAGEAKALVTAALNDAVYIASLTSNLRLASRLREGLDPPAADGAIDLVQIVRRIEIRERVFARQRGIVLAVAFPDAPLHVRAEPTQTEQAVTNVVQNALSYGDDGGHVSLVLERVGRTGFELRVDDDGPGVATTEIPRLGGRAFRSDAARQRDPKGSGLGLAITRAVCERNGWELRFAPVDPRGLSVTIRGASCEATS